MSVRNAEAGALVGDDGRGSTRGRRLTRETLEWSLTGVEPGGCNEWMVHGASPGRIFISDPDAILVRRPFPSPTAISDPDRIFATRCSLATIRDMLPQRPFVTMTPTGPDHVWQAFELGVPGSR